MGIKFLKQILSHGNFIFLRSPAAKSNSKYATGSFPYTSPGAALPPVDTGGMTR
jgi:hypothetical protein